MESIDVRGLPDPVASALQSMVQTLRDQLLENGSEARLKSPTKVSLPLWPGKVIGSLRREDLYGDCV